MTFNRNAPECIRQTPAGCSITFVSAAVGGAKVAINGTALLQNDGSFAGAALVEGALSRTGCGGLWDPGTSTMTVDCGGMGSTQSCVLGLHRTSSVCP
jgi:hypothetical protein